VNGLKMASGEWSMSGNGVELIGTDGLGNWLLMSSQRPAVATWLVIDH